jgi:hypothetical protein
MVEDRMNIEQWWNGTEKGKIEEFGKKPVPVPLCPTVIT